MCAAKERDRKVQVGRAGVCEKDTKEKRRKIRGGPSGERNRKVKSSREDREDRGREEQTNDDTPHFLTHGYYYSLPARNVARGGGSDFL